MFGESQKTDEEMEKEIRKKTARVNENDEFFRRNERQRLIDYVCVGPNASFCCVATVSDFWDD